MDETDEPVNDRGDRHAKYREDNRDTLKAKAIAYRARLTMLKELERLAQGLPEPRRGRPRKAPDTTSSG